MGHVISLVIFKKLTMELISGRKTSHKHNNKDVPLVRFMYLVLPGESNHKRLKSLLCLCDVLCVDSARALWVSFCFKFMFLLAESFTGYWILVDESHLPG